jgi:hypothetical protein
VFIPAIFIGAGDLTPAVFFGAGNITFEIKIVYIFTFCHLCIQKILTQID